MHFILYTLYNRLLHLLYVLLWCAQKVDTLRLRKATATEMVMRPTFLRALTTPLGWL